MSAGGWAEIDRAELERRHLEASDLLLAAQEEIARLAGAVERVLREIDAANADLLVAHQDIARLESEVALRNEALAGVLDSASWRVTRPLRSFKSLLRETDA